MATGNQTDHYDEVTPSDDVAPIASGAALRAPRVEGFKKQLPTGIWVRLRYVSPDMLILGGEVPNSLAGLVTKMAFDGVDSDAMQQQIIAISEPHRTLEFAGESIQLLNAVCKLAFVQPRIVNKPSADDECSIEDIELVDRGAVFRMCTHSIDALRRFRYEPPPDVSSIPDGDADGEPPVNADRDDVGE